MEHHFAAIASRFGEILIVEGTRGKAGQVVRSIIPVPGADSRQTMLAEFPGITEGGSPQLDRVATDMARYLAGAAIAFPLHVLALDRCSPFQRQVLTAEHGIPRGQVSTYSRIARHLGQPRAARAVGHALATNPFPLLIPCHRAVRADGALGGYQGGLAMKRELLEMEGVTISASGKVIAPRFYY